MKTGAFINWNAWWWGVHWSPHNKRWCINLFPCCTIWIVKEGGNIPDRVKKKTLSRAKELNTDNHGAMSI